MRIFILRHEDRTQDASFFAPLTKNGLDKSIKLIPILNELYISHIYSSPYIRTLQTIYPFIKENKKNIKLEYSLSEINDLELISKNSAGTNLPQYLAESFMYDPKYNSVIQPENIKYPETEKDVVNRLKIFLRILITNHIKTDDNILIVSHQVICSNILKIVNKHLKEKLSREEINNYPVGSLSMIFDHNNWDFKPINWKIKN
jgi:broad specificity phosphatase PhoE